MIPNTHFSNMQSKSSASHPIQNNHLSQNWLEALMKSYDHVVKKCQIFFHKSMAEARGVRVSQRTYAIIGTYTKLKYHADDVQISTKISNLPMPSMW